MKTRSAGFTLMELMVTLALAAVILSIGAPSFGEFRRNNRLTSVGNEFLGAVQTARTEAIKRQTPVAVCPSADPTDAGATCTSGAFNGWIVFVDSNSNGDRDAAGFDDIDGDEHQDIDEDANDNGILDGGEDDDGDGHLDVAEDDIEAEEILLQHAPLDPGVTAVSRDTDDDETDFIVTYNSTGFTTATNVSAVVLCDARGNKASFGDLSAARGITVSATGRVATTRGIQEIEDLGGC